MSAPGRARSRLDASIACFDAAARDDLRRSSGRNSVLVVAAQLLRGSLEIVSLLVLARLLTPVDFGLVGMATAITGMVGLVSHLGLTQATVQRPVLTHALVSTLFWVGLGLALLLAVLLVAAAPLIAGLYDQPQLELITPVLALVVLLGGALIQPRALLIRALRFRTLATIDIAASSVGIVCAVGLAWLGAGWWALLGLRLVEVGLRLGLVWGAAGWIPGWPRRDPGLREMLGFGGHMLGFSLVNHAARNADDVLIGWAWGPAALGLYSRAYQLLKAPLWLACWPVASVAVASLSHLSAQPKAFAELYQSLVVRLCWLTLPLVAILIVWADVVLLWLLGPQWIDAAPIFRLLGIAAFGQTIYSSLGWVFVSLGRGAHLLRWSLLMLPIALTGFLLGLPFGPAGVATAYSVVFCAVILPWSLRYAYAGTAIRLSRLLPPLIGPSVLATGCILSGLGARWWLPDSAPVMTTFAAMLMSSAVAVAPIAAVGRLRRQALAATVDLLPKNSC